MQEKIISKFTIREAFADGWDKTKKHWKVMIPIMLILIIISSILDSIRGGLGTILSLAFSAWTGFNLINILFKLSDNHKVEIFDIFYFEKSKLGRIGYWFLANVILGIIVVFGFVLFIIPGVYLANRYLFVPYIMAQENIDIFDAFKKSWDATKNDVWHLAGMWLLTILVAAAGLMLFVVGIVPAVILIMFANVYLYKKFFA